MKLLPPSRENTCPDSLNSNWNHFEPCSRWVWFDLFACDWSLKKRVPQDFGRYRIIGQLFFSHCGIFFYLYLSFFFPIVFTCLVFPIFEWELILGKGSHYSFVICIENDIYTHGYTTIFETIKYIVKPLKRLKSHPALSRAPETIPNTKDRYIWHKEYILRGIATCPTSIESVPPDRTQLE